MHPVIEQTSDYDQFKTVSFNRDKNKKHIDELKQMITQDNRLHLHPILVNHENEVIDGQHRLEAAKELLVPIYFIRDNINYSHILDSNRLQKNLILKDVIKYYALKDRVTDYIEFRDYMDALRLQPKALFGLLFGTTSSHMIKHLKSGKFKMPPEKFLVKRLIDGYLDFIAFAEQKRVRPKSMFSSHFFTVGLRHLLTNKHFDDHIFYQKLENKWFELKPQLDSIQWAKCLLSIYNWKNKNQLEVDLGDEK